MDREKLEEISQKVDEVKQLFESTMDKIKEKEEIIKQKDNRIQELTDKLVILSKEKDDALWEKIDIMKAITQEREDLHEEINQLKTEIMNQENKVKKMKKKSREVQDGLIGTSFEVDRMKKEVDKKDQTIKDIEKKIASVSSGSTGILYDLHSAIEYLTERIKESNRSLRIVAPSIEFLEENGIIRLMDDIPESCVVNIATALDMNIHVDLIDNWKNKGWVVHNYQGRNFLMSSANGSDVSIAYITEGKVSGFYSNIQDLVIIFKQALMHPYVKGQKL
jgi:predicted  nucleic acid-binding Zn-ribbon protein